MKKILYVIGSTRAKSFNRQLACAARAMIGERVEVTELNYSDLPWLNQDVEQLVSGVVSRVSKTVAEADALSEQTG